MAAVAARMMATAAAPRIVAAALPAARLTAATASICGIAAVGAAAASGQAAPLQLLLDPFLCMNRNKREPKKANHGARPCSNRRRRRMKRLRRSPG
ncbi:hypothetical protein FNF27_02887 [Cafeteria roenbergensis]|uniref:Uncharacterized protein n=1 Tax=Cafeteria roenbergensis TaxID=33653 RepID=A0A5A8CLW5_CAFRO|nr:hypothetical protein FNF29_03261 [Cafeteria roenbergensis]KAA0161157.1 hypothetical protein FNF31_03998 [Cafeteria roenbergensis]KAA0170827.1 hypothetical protein FNF28_01100 [Cafeteria roenbergensis]KAA0175801.1 hypothetical protein FNF27_02887 [Cafeteria roenbergensis]|eukprot:KAA0153444.1 hypothetical protein FNF29_03261 [Cafeteria roenbergensis]